MLRSMEIHLSHCDMQSSDGFALLVLHWGTDVLVGYKILSLIQHLIPPSYLIAKD